MWDLVAQEGDKEIMLGGEREPGEDKEGGASRLKDEELLGFMASLAKMLRHRMSLSHVFF